MKDKKVFCGLYNLFNHSLCNFGFTEITQSFSDDHKTATRKRKSVHGVFKVAQRTVLNIR